MNSNKVIVKDGKKNITSVDLTVSENVKSLSFWQLFIRGIIDTVSGNIHFSLN